MPRHPMSRVLVCGTLAGLAAGAVVAVWFLAVDLATATALDTPARLASLWLSEGYVGPTARLVVTYTVLHFGVFAVIGLGTAWVLNAVGLEARLLAGAVVGVAIVNGVYYGGRLFLGLDLLNSLPMIHVLGANLAGGIVMMWYLHGALKAEGPFGVRMLERYPLAREGLVTGIMGAASVALWFLLIDIATGNPLSTPAALGSAVFLGATASVDVVVNPAVVGAYTVLHVLAFWVVGTAFVWAAKRVEQAPGWWMIAVLAFIVLEGLFLGVVGSLSAWILGSVGWWAIGIGNLVAVFAMATFIWRTHPVLRTRLAEAALETRV